MPLKLALLITIGLLTLDSAGLALSTNNSWKNIPASLWSSINTPLYPRSNLPVPPKHAQLLEKRAINKTVWVSSDVYEGATFFDAWDFFTEADPTHGYVDFVDRDTAFRNGLIEVTEEGRAIMRVDNWTAISVDDIKSGRQYRQSVRISTKKTYNGGLFILDVAKSPFGCGVWSAYWMTSNPWPNNGEIDIIENVHNSLSNQVSWHTLPWCNLTSPGNFTGTTVRTECNAYSEFNAGCNVVDQSIASFGPTFNEKGGGVYATKWDEESIDVWFFYRSAIPDDILTGLPDPSTWRLPTASISAQGCNIFQYFHDLQLIFDTTLCGDWAGTSYASAGCPGTCEDRVANPANFGNTTWSINSIKIYTKAIIDTSYLDSGPASMQMSMSLYVCLVIGAILSLVHLDRFVV